MAFAPPDLNALKKPLDPSVQQAGLPAAGPQNAGGALSPLGTPQAGGSAPPAPPPVAPPPAPVAPPAAPAAPAGGIDPAAAQQQLAAQFQTRFGRAMTPAEQTEFQKRLGYTPGGAINDGMMSQGSSLISQYTGNMADYQGSAPKPAGTLSDQMLEQLISTGSTPAMSNVDPNSPAMALQRNAFNRASGQATTRQRMAAAERNAARGTSGAGGFDAELAGIENEAGNQRTDFESQLMRGELDGQRNRVMQGMLTGVDAGLRREGMGSQERLGRGQLSLGLLQSLMGNQRAQDALGFNYTQLGQQGRQFDLSTILSQL